MKKLLSFLMLVTASFLLVLSVVPSTHAAIVDTDDFTFTVTSGTTSTDGTALFEFIDDNVTGTYSAAQAMSEFEVSITVLDYNETAVRYLFSDYYIINFSDVDNDNYWTIHIHEDGTIDLSDSSTTFANGSYTLTLNVVEYGPADYDDLFYEDLTISLTRNTDHTATDIVGAENIEVMWELLKSKLPTNTHIQPEDYNAIGLTITASPELTSNLTGNLYIYGIPSTISPLGTLFSFGRNSASGSGASTLNFRNDVENPIGHGNSGGPNSTFSEAQVYTVTLKVLKSWTQAYSHGRYRTSNGDQYYLTYEEEGSSLTDIPGVYLSGSLAGSLRAFSTENSLDPHESITLQSPYKNFKIEYGSSGSRTTLVDVEDVAAVQIHRYSAFLPVVVRIWHWVDGDIAYQEISAGVLNSHPTTTNIFFYGSHRQAISGDLVMVANVDDEEPLSYFLAFLTAWDDIDGDISDLIYVVNDDYTGNEDTLGTYSVTAGVEDSEGQESTLTFDIVVIDVTDPMGPASNTVNNVSYTTTFDLNAYITGYILENFTDNYDDAEDLTVTIVFDSYTATKTNPGSKNVVYKIEDTSGNSVQHSLTINVIDNIPPVFTSGVETLNKDINQLITAAQIIATQVATDAINGNVSSSIVIVTDGYSGNETTPGSYQLVIRAFDAANNQVTRTINITVYSGVPGWWIPNDGPIIIPHGTELTQEQLESVLLSVGWLSLDVEFQFLSSEYFGNEGTPGTYQLNYSIAGVPTQFNLLVLNQGDNYFPDIPTPPVQAAIPSLNWVWWTAGSIIAVGLIGAGIYLYNKRKIA